MTFSSPFELGMTSVLAGVVDMVIPAGTASLVGVETIAGVEAEHYTFTIEGLGTGSGAQIDANDGDVWVSVDGGDGKCAPLNQILDLITQRRSLRRRCRAAS
ncbi:hypothetical protein N9574_00405 [bacterium]|nr:hypothetical protein [bacterium]